MKKMKSNAKRLVNPIPSALDAALRVASEHELPLVPCNAKKVPIFKGWNTGELRGKKEVVKAFGGPGVELVGVRTGAVSNLMVVDIDPRNGGDKWYRKNRSRLNCKRIHKTRSGGLHLLYQMPTESIRNSVGKIAPGVDVRGDGGQIIWWPAHGFGVVADGKPGAVPAWLLNKITGRKGGPSVSPTTQGPEIAKGRRNDQLTREAGLLRRCGLGADEMEAALLEINRRRCTPPLPRTEVRQIVESVSKYPTSATEDSITEGDIVDTDMANAKRLVAKFDGNARYTPERGWVVYDLRQWVVDDYGRVMALAKASVRDILDEFKKSPLQNQLPKWARQSQSVDRLRAAIELAKSEPLVPARLSDFDTDPLLLNVENGTLDLRTGSLLPHSREHLITRLCPVMWDPRAKCPRFKSFLRRVLGDDEELYRYVIRVIGYLLCGLTDEQVFFFCYGTGRNGKSVLIETIQRLLGNYATTARAETIMARRGTAGIPNDIAALKGVRFVAMNETGEGQRLNEPLVKDLTGGDTISARFLHHEFFTFRPEFKLCIRGNHKPMISGGDLGIWRRVHLIPFAVTIPEDEVDPRLAATLQDELPGILRLAVRGFLDWQRGGLRPPARILAAVEQYRDEMDTFGEFVRDSIEPRAGGKLPATVVYDEYKLWCDARGEHPVSQKRFGLSLQERGIERRHTRKGSVYVGCCLRDGGPRLLHSGA